MSLFNVELLDKARDASLDARIDELEFQLSLLKELKSRRHQTDHRVKDGLYTEAYGFHQVTCTCGEITDYKVPLDALSDFVCPKDPNRKGRKET